MVTGGGAGGADPPGDYSVQLTLLIDAQHKGTMVVTVREAKAPLAARRFLELVRARFLNGSSPAVEEAAPLPS